MKRASLAFGILLSSVVLVDCGAKILGPDDDLGSQGSEVVTANNSITTSQTVNGSTPGDSGGDFQVTDSGSASYTVPLWTPPGPMDMAPSLTLSYDSSAASGSLGVGFSIQGNVISRIARCPKTILVDGDVSPIEVGGTTYCLDGKRLIPTTSNPAEYRTQRDDGSKIVRLGTDAASPTGWTVWLRGGQILTYGVDPAARLVGKVKPTYCPAGSSSCDQAFVTASADVTLAWALERVQDRVNQISGAAHPTYGNFMTIKYTTLSTAMPPAGTPAGTIKYGSDFDFKEMLISEVQYAHGTGTTPSRKVVFKYRATPRTDAQYFWIAGVPIMSTKLLSSIEMYGPHPTTAGMTTAVLKVYDLGYDGLYSVAGRSRLKSLAECDNISTVTTRVCRSTSFNWENGSNTFREVLSAPVNFNSATSINVLDYNADGKTDVMLRSTGTEGNWTHQIFTSQMGPDLALPGTPTPSEPIHYEPVPGSLANVEYPALTVSPIDFDGDSRHDLAALASPGQTTGGSSGDKMGFDIYRNAGNRWDWQTEPFPSGEGYDDSFHSLMPPIFPDLDGDGLPEQVQLGRIKARNSGSTQDEYSLLVFRRNATGGVPGALGVRSFLREGSNAYTLQSNTQYHTLSSGVRIGYSNYEPYIQDIDGSGRGWLLIQDSFTTTSAAPPSVNVNQLNGTNQMRAIYLTRAGEVKSKLAALGAHRRDFSGAHYIWLDVNGDGLSDALEIFNANTSGGRLAKSPEVAPHAAFLRMNTGAGFKRYTGSYSEANAGNAHAINARTDAGVLVGDIDQDGLDDIVLTGKAIHNGVTNRAEMRALVASVGTTPSSHLVGQSLPLRTLNGQPIPTVDSFVTGYSPNPALQGDTAVPVSLGDFNGDGLLDIVAYRYTGGFPRLHFYIHQGKKADLLTGVDTTSGRHLAIEYKSSSDQAVYRRMRGAEPIPGALGGAWNQPAHCQYPKRCATGGLWLVSRYLVTNDQNQDVGHTMRYSEGRYSRGEWLGLAERFDNDDTNGVLSATTYDNRTPGTNERYPFALLPAQTRRIARDTGGAPGMNEPHRFITTNHYQEKANFFTPNSYSALLTDSGDVEEMLSGVPPSLPVEHVLFDDDSYATDTLANATTYFGYDQWDNIKSEKRVNADQIELDVTNTLVSNNTSDWRMNVIREITETSTNHWTQETARRVRRITQFSFTHLTLAETIEEAGGNGVKQVITYERAAGALGQVTKKTTTTWSTADDIRYPTVGTPLNRIETTTYDAVDGVTVASKTNALGHKTLFAYHNGRGLLAQTEDPNGVKTTYQYDTFNRLRKRTTPTAGDYSVSYEGLPTFPNNIASIVSALGPKYAVHTTPVGGEETIVTYNKNGRELLWQTRAGDGAYRYVLTRYTPTLAQVASASQPFRSGDIVLPVTSYTYNRFGRRIEIRNPEGTTQKFNITPRFGPLGYVTTITNERGHVREEVRDDSDLIQSVTEYPNGVAATTTFNYGPFGLVRSINPPPVVSGAGTKSAGESYAYDVLGRRVQETNGDAGTKVFSYNGFGEVVAEKDGNPDAAARLPTTYFKRDALGRVIERSNTTDGTSANTYEWDTAPRGTTTGVKALGKISIMRSFDGTNTTYAYDTYARPDVTTWNINNRSYAMKQTYIAGTGAGTGQVGQIDYPGMGTGGATKLRVFLGYDAAGGLSSVRKTSVTGPAYWTATNWWTDGQLEKQQDGAGMVTTRSYDPNRRWLTGIKTATASGTNTIQDVSYGRDPAGNVTGRGDNDPAVQTFESFSYDETHKLQSWTFDSSAGNWMTGYSPGRDETITQGKIGPGVTSLNYDYFGNASSQLPHAVRSINAKSMTYDAHGRQTRTYSDKTVSYSSFDLPKSISNLSGTVLASYKYDADNNRVFKNYNGEQLTSIAGMYERNAPASGAVKHTMYIRGPGNRVVAQETWNESGSTVTTTPVVYHHDDIVGSTVVINTGNTTASATRFRFDPYGQRISPKDPSLVPYACLPSNPSTCPPTKIGFTGHEMDDEFGHINMKGRIYDAKIARFLTPDPFVSAPYSANGYDRYGYALNNPMKYTDPSGLMIPLSDMYFSLWGYGDAINFFSYLNVWGERIAREVWSKAHPAGPPPTEAELQAQRDANLAKAMAEVKKGKQGKKIYLDNSQVKVVPAGQVPPQVAARARNWWRANNASARMADREVGRTRVRTSAGEASRPLANATRSSAEVVLAEGDIPLQVDHSHMDGTSVHPTNFDLGVTIELGVPIGTHYFGSNSTINVMWWEQTPQGLRPRQAFIGIPSN